jgi:Holliday junction resolvase RusA-like endonuclease
MWSPVWSNSIPGKPIQLNRPRFSKYGVFHDKKNKAAKEHIIDMILQRDPDVDIKPHDPISVVLTFVHPRPKKYNRKKDTHERIPKTTKPDIDNLVKMILDCLQRTPLLHDDKQVVMLCASDWFCGKFEHPHTKIQIFRASPYEP